MCVVSLYYNVSPLRARTVLLFCLYLPLAQYLAYSKCLLNFFHSLISFSLYSTDICLSVTYLLILHLLASAKQKSNLFSPLQRPLQDSNSEDIFKDSYEGLERWIGHMAREMYQALTWHPWNKRQRKFSSPSWQDPNGTWWCMDRLKFMHVVGRIQYSISRNSHSWVS